MVDPVVTSAIIGAGATLAGQGAQMAANAVKNKKQFKIWKKQQAIMNQYQEDAEQRQQGYLAEQNRYNSPDAQMARYRAAGLNANLVSGAQPVQSDAVSAGVQSAGALPVSSFMEGVDPAQGYQMYMQAEQLQLQKEIAKADIRKTDAEADATEIDNKTREASNNLALAIQELQKTGVDLDNKSKELSNDVASIQKYILDHTKDFEIEYKEFLAKDKENEYQFNASERAFNVSIQGERLTQLKQKIIQDWLNISLTRLNIDKEKVMKALYTALAPLADKVIPSLASGISSIVDYFKSDGFSTDSSNFFGFISNALSDAGKAMNDPMYLYQLIKDAFTEPDHQNILSWQPRQKMSWSVKPHRNMSWSVKPTPKNLSWNLKK